MTRAQYRKQLKTKSWAKFRQIALAFHGSQCIICGMFSRLQVHHNWYIDERKAWQYNMRDVAIMCKSCHSLYHQEHPIKFYDKNLKLKYKKFTK